ncbi:hypothetical protein PV10_02641 [Exophiala mesophila]|uniref:Thioesterase domain-containing protein n=1 Tax=Exophiala mesophila TaxID=212818 RepID=A0A0D1Y2V8_EXOME|nr:uncharacterized protein PV10_02641 [Exophiala mesophila]KIV94921.1 hypothetical protein PV10_02641 [Exophiala mesophila]
MSTPVTPEAAEKPSTAGAGGVTLAAPAPEQDVDGLLQTAVSSHTEIQDLLQDPTVNIKLHRAVLKVDQEYLADHLTLTTLTGPGLISPQPYVFTNDDAGTLWAFYHLGRRLAGHSGIVHGGLVAALLDECMGRACFPLLAGKIAVTAKLEVSYMAPVRVDSVIVLKAETVDVQGRKAWVEGTVEHLSLGRLEGKTTMAKATGLFIEPKWASEMGKMM